MPRIVDYPLVLEKLLGRGLVSLYHNAGAFGFPRSTEELRFGWLGEPDATIKEPSRPFTRQVAEPFAETLADLLVVARRRLGGEAWLMPKSHWHFELHDGHPALLEAMLPELGIDPATLRDRNDGSAVAFSIDEDERLRHAAARLLSGMRFSDFAVAFPGAPALGVATLHHHRQIWWQTNDPDFMAWLRGQSTQSSSPPG